MICSAMKTLMFSPAVSLLARIALSVNATIRTRNTILLSFHPELRTEHLARTEAEKRQDDKDKGWVSYAAQDIQEKQWSIHDRH